MTPCPNPQPSVSSSTTAPPSNHTVSSSTSYHSPQPLFFDPSLQSHPQHTPTPPHPPPLPQVIPTSLSSNISQVSYQTPQVLDPTHQFFRDHDTLMKAFSRPPTTTSLSSRASTQGINQDTSQESPNQLQKNKQKFFNIF